MDKSTAKPGPLQTLTDYCMHVLVATIGAMALAALILFVVAVTLSATRVGFSLTWYQRLLVQRPFPVQVVAAFMLGLLFAHRLNRPEWSMWAWALPALVLVGRILLWEPRSVLYEGARFAHFFGPCPHPYCADQFTATLPLYAAVSYSVAAATRAYAVPLGTASE